MFLFCKSSKIGLGAFTLPGNFIDGVSDNVVNGKSFHSPSKHLGFCVVAVVVCF